jgi:hypothetical protein
LTFSAEGNLPANFSVDAATGAIHWTPSRQQAGHHSLLLRVTDDGGSVSQPLEIDVSCAKEALQAGCSSAGSEALGLLAAGLAIAALRRSRRCVRRF